MPYIIKSQIKNYTVNSHMKVEGIFKEENLARFYLNKLAEKDKLRVESEKPVISYATGREHYPNGFRNPPREFFIEHYEFMDDKALLSSFKG